MTADIFDKILEEANFPSLFLRQAKMEGDFLCTIIGNRFYYINIITQEWGHCDSQHKKYVFSGYRFSNVTPISRETGKRIPAKRKFDLVDDEDFIQIQVDFD